MEIEIYELSEGAKKAEGLAVIIDVFRAFSLEAHLFGQGAEKIYAVEKQETARILKMHHDDYLLVGERGGRMLPGFDYGNSPAQMEGIDLKGKTIIHTTSSGTKGLASAMNADLLLTGSLNNAKAIADYIKKKNPKKVSLVAMGLAGKKSAAEDLLCARYIKSLLLREEMDLKAEVSKLKEDPVLKTFFDLKEQRDFPERDFFLCTEWDKFDFVLKAQKVAHDTYEVTRVSD